MSPFRLITFLMLTFFTVCCMAQADIGLKSVGGHAGLSKVSDIDGTIGFGAMVGLGTIIPAVQLQFDLDYWSKGASESSVDGTNSATASGSFSDLSFTILGKYMLSAGSAALKPYVKGGVGLHRYKAEASFDVDLGEFGSFGDTVSATSTEFGLDLGGGVAFAASPKLDVIGDVVYRLVSNANTLFLTGGLLFHLN